MKNRRSERLAVCLLALALALAPVVSAEPAPDAPAADDERVARAREAFRLGSALAREGQWTDALAAFERSASLRPHATTTYNLGFCERALGHYTRARKLLGTALDDERRHELSAETRAEARAYLAEVERKVVHATVTLRGPGARITIDGRPLERAPGARARWVAGTRDPGPAELVPAGTFQLLVDPGTRVLLVDGRARNVRFVSGETPSLTLGEAPVPERAAAPPPDRGWAIAALGVGAAGLLVGTVSGITALREKSSLDEHCTRGIDRCDPRYQGDIDNMHRAAAISSVAFAVGALGVGAGVALWVSAPSAEGRRSAALSLVRPW